MNRRSTVLTRAAALLGSLTIVAASGLAAAPAFAAEATITTFEVVITPSIIPRGGQITTDLDLCIADAATAGDTITIALPPEMETSSLNTAPFPLRDAAGNLIANGVITQGPPAFMTLTLTDFVDDSQNVCMSATFNSFVEAPAGAHELVFTPGSGPSASDGVTITSPPVGPGAPTKTGSWTRPADQGRNFQIGAIRWTVMSPVGPLSSYRFSDTASAGQTFNCTNDLVPVVQRGMRDPANSFVFLPTPAAVTLDPSQYTISCSDTTFTFELTDASMLTAGESVRVRFFTDLTEPTSNAATTFPNTVNVTWTPTDGTRQTQSVPASVSSNGVDGGGSGDQLAVVKFHTPQGPVDGDHDVAPGLEAPAGAPVPVTITVTNNSQPLRQVIVTDQTLAGPAMTGLSCDFSPLGGPVSGTTWDGPLATGASFTCTGTVPALANGELHSDRVIAEGTGNGKVYGSDPFNVTGTTPPVPPAVSVGDYVWLDTDRDGIQDAGEPGIPAVVLVLTGPDGQPVTDVFGNPVLPVTTDAEGLYTFNNLPALPAGQSYTVTIDQVESTTALAQYIPTVPGAGDDSAADSSNWTASSGDLTQNGDRDPTLDFGFVRPTYAVGDYVWIDTDKDGTQEADEAPLPGVTVVLRDGDGIEISRTTTDARGRYLFDDLPAGTYRVQFVLTPAQAEIYSFTRLNGGATRTDSDADGTGWTIAFVLDDSNPSLTTDYDREIFAVGGIDPTWDAGVIVKDKSSTPPPSEEPSEPPSTTPSPSTPPTTPSTMPPATTSAPAGTPLASTGVNVALVVGTAALLLTLGACATLARRLRTSDESD